MRRTKSFILIILVLIYALTHVSTVLAHPADIYIHSLHLTFTKSGLSIEWEIKPGPMLVSSIWLEADVNQDNFVSTQEAAQWAGKRIALLNTTLAGRPLSLHMDDVKFPSSRDAFQSGAENVVITLSTERPQDLGTSYEITLHNQVEEQKSVTWYYITALDEIQFQTPQQRNSIITLNIFGPAAQTPPGLSLRTNWDSSMPSLSQKPTTSPKTNTSTLSNYIPDERKSSQDILLNIVRQKEISVTFYIFALGISLLLGALHALTPGHGKTVVAAYLVGSRGTMWHAVALGTVVTLTHTGSVFLLGILTLAASQYILPTTLIPVMEILSGLLILGLGLYLLWQRYQYWRNTKLIIPNTPPRKFVLAHHSPASKIPSGNVKIERPLLRHEHHHGDGRVHSHDVPEAITWRSLIALGVSGGLVPCPDAIAILLVAVAINRIVLGLALIVSFSFGLAVVLIVIGLLMVNSRRLFERISIFDTLAPVLPIISALVVLALGTALTLSAYARAKDEFHFAGTGLESMKEAQVIYLAGGQDKTRQLFIVNSNGTNPFLLSELADNVIEFAISQDKNKVVYIAKNENLEYSIWLVDLKNRERTGLLQCDNAICARPIWSPDGTQIVFEYVRLSGNNVTGLTTLWWLDIATGKVQPVFQDENLPGSSPRWSPDGMWLSYVTSQNVRLYNLKTGENHIINSTLTTAADWSPNGKAVLYRDVVIQNGQFVTQLFVYDLASQTSKNITQNASFENLYATWSPDGEWIAAVRRDLSMTMGDQIWLMRTDGSEAHTLTGQPNQLHGNLSWSPDGKYLLYDLYVSNTSLEPNVQAIEVSTGQISDLGIQGVNPSWLWP